MFPVHSGHFTNLSVYKRLSDLLDSGPACSQVNRINASQKQLAQGVQVVTCICVARDPSVVKIEVLPPGSDELTASAVSYILEWREEAEGSNPKMPLD